MWHNSHPPEWGRRKIPLSFIHVTKVIIPACISGQLQSQVWETEAGSWNKRLFDHEFIPKQRRLIVQLSVDLCNELGFMVSFKCCLRRKTLWTTFCIHFDWLIDWLVNSFYSITSVHILFFYFLKTLNMHECCSENSRSLMSFTACAKAVLASAFTDTLAFVLQWQELRET